MSKLVIGIDIGGTNTRLGIVNEDGEILNESSFSTSAYDEIDDYRKALQDHAAQLIKYADDRGIGKIAGIGIGAPNGNYYNGSIEDAPNLRWKGTLPLAKNMQDHFNITCRLTNDANAAALGEMLFGSAKDYRHFIVITLGTGLGSGIVVDGKMVYGHDGFAGEVGHSTVVHGGRQCGCGRKGCLETYASATGIKRTVAELLANSIEPSSLRKIPFNALDARVIFEEAQKNDPIAMQAFEFTGNMLGRALANAIVYTSPEAIILMGGLAEAGKLILDPTKKSMEENVLHLYRGKVKLSVSSLKAHNTALLGAAAIVWQEPTS
jgi:glucokinase